MRANTFAFASALAATVVAQTATTSSSGGTTVTPTGPVASITFPGSIGDEQVLVGSIIGSAGSLTTIAIGCPDGTSSDDCGFDPSATLTYGPTTLAFTIDYSGYSVAQDCSFGSAGGVCTMTAPSDSETATDGSISLATSTTSFGASELQVATIIVTAGQTGGLAGAGSASSTSGAATSQSGTQTTTRSGTQTTTTSRAGSQTSTSAGPTTTSRPNDAKALAPGAFGAAMLGLAAVLL